MFRASHRIRAKLLILIMGLSPMPVSAMPWRIDEPRVPAHATVAIAAVAERPSKALERYATFAPDTLTGTVSYVHAEDATVHVITGVQLALRVVSFRLVADARIEKAGVTIAMEELAPGDVVRIDYRATPEGNLADEIQVVVPPAEGGAQ